ncbi:hypothetical protein GN956_G8345 [Arapaima gigas]
MRKPNQALGASAASIRGVCCLTFPQTLDKGTRPSLGYIIFQERFDVSREGVTSERSLRPPGASLPQRRSCSLRGSRTPRFPGTELPVMSSS